MCVLTSVNFARSFICSIICIASPGIILDSVRGLIVFTRYSNVIKRTSFDTRFERIHLRIMTGQKTKRYDERNRETRISRRKRRVKGAKPDNGEKERDLA